MQPGDLCWVEFGAFPTWPCRIAKRTEVGKNVLDLEQPNTTLYYFFGSHDYAWVDPDLTYDFESCHDKFSTKSKMAQFRKGVQEANEWKNSKERVFPVAKAARKRVVVSDESGEEVEDIDDSDAEPETSKSSKAKKNTNRTSSSSKRTKEPIQVDSGESDLSGPEDDFKPSNKSKSTAALSLKQSSKAKAETKKPKISTRSRVLKTVQSTANIGSDRARSLEITRADRNGITINNTKTAGNGSAKTEKSAKNESTSNGHHNKGIKNEAHKSNGHREERKEDRGDEDEYKDNYSDREDDRKEDENDEILTELMSAQHRPEEQRDEESEDQQDDHWFAPTQPYRSDDSDDETRAKKLRPARVTQTKRSPPSKRSHDDNADETRLGESVEIIPAGKSSNRMTVDGHHTVSLQERKSDQAKVNTNARNSLTASNSRRRSDETGDTGSHQNNSESLFDDSHSPIASNGKTNHRAPGTPMHLVSPPLEPRGSSPFLSKSKHKRRISEVSPTQRVLPSYDFEESASLFDDLTSPSGHIIKRRRVTDAQLNNAVPAALDMSVVKELIESEVTLKLSAATADWENRFKGLREDWDKQQGQVMDKVKDLLKQQKNDVQNILKQQKTSLEQILANQKTENKNHIKDLTEQIETVSGSISELDKRLEEHTKQLTEQQAAMVEKSISGAEALLASLRGLSNKPK